MPFKTPAPITQNIESIAAFYKREEQKLTWSQRLVEGVSNIVGRPIFVGCIILFVTLWLLANVIALQLGMTAVDPPPFVWLQGIVSLGALLTATVVLIDQERLAKLEERREHLDLQDGLAYLDGSRAERGQSGECCSQASVRPMRVVLDLLSRYS